MTSGGGVGGLPGIAGALGRYALLVRERELGVGGARLTQPFERASPTGA